ncbi:YigZ family protein [Sulfitobacter sp. F26169L]|uniref:YigZ family protein n=1 Tax=Sulfitobacter sp. F26169L TaxID=2996015 RepID=UPI002260A948|nr:YigZ family protein [Sulfitobacter sp. F26169L]MCX7567190.1 YigZ family protein [Sulfitobacter sp. F26169L]
MRKLGQILNDKGSKYAVSGVPVQSRADVDAALKLLKRDKSYAKATHNTWGVLLPDEGPLKADDGESGAGMIILRMLEREDLPGHLIIVTRWYGGKHLGGDRFRHVQTCVRSYLDALSDAKTDRRKKAD